MIGSPERVKIQRSLVQNLCKIQQRLKIIACFLTFGGLKYPQTVTTNFGGQNNIKNEISTIKLLRWKIFSKIKQLLKNHYLRGIFNIFGVKMPPRGELEFSRHIHYDFLKEDRKNNFHTKNKGAMLWSLGSGQTQSWKK